jgi:hypothetical protein
MRGGMATRPVVARLAPPCPVWSGGVFFSLPTPTSARAHCLPLSPKSPTCLPHAAHMSRAAPGIRGPWCQPPFSQPPWSRCVRVGATVWWCGFGSCWCSAAQQYRSLLVDAPSALPPLQGCPLLCLVLYTRPPEKPSQACKPSALDFLVQPCPRPPPTFSGPPTLATHTVAC